MERNSRKVYQGTVISDKMDKTVTVLVETHKMHKLYGKRVKSLKSLRLMMQRESLKTGISSELWKLVHYLRRNTSVLSKSLRKQTLFNI